MAIAYKRVRAGYVVYQVGVDTIQAKYEAHRSGSSKSPESAQGTINADEPVNIVPKFVGDVKKSKNAKTMKTERVLWTARTTLTDQAEHSFRLSALHEGHATWYCCEQDRQRERHKQTGWRESVDGAKGTDDRSSRVDAISASVQQGADGTDRFHGQHTVDNAENAIGANNTYGIDLTDLAHGMYGAVAAVFADGADGSSGTDYVDDAIITVGSDSVNDVIGNGGEYIPDSTDGGNGAAVDGTNSAIGSDVSGGAEYLANLEYTICAIWALASTIDTL